MYIASSARGSAQLPRGPYSGGDVMSREYVAWCCVLCVAVMLLLGAAYLLWSAPAGVL